MSPRCRRAASTPTRTRSSTGWPPQASPGGRCCRSARPTRSAPPIARARRSPARRRCSPSPTRPSRTPRSASCASARRSGSATGRATRVVARRSLDQVRFEREWRALREYAAQRGVRLIGDLPLYVAPASVDHRAHPELFQRGRVAGAPPDAFAARGQRWGNPLYDWPALQRRHYRWWIERLRRSIALFDLVRIDHFRGFVAYWSISAHARDAAGGHWQRGPGGAPFEAARRELGRLPLIAEDLGSITPRCRACATRSASRGWSCSSSATRATRRARAIRSARARGQLADLHGHPRPQHARRLVARPGRADARPRARGARRAGHRLARRRARPPVADPPRVQLAGARGDDPDAGSAGPRQRGAHERPRRGRRQLGMEARARRADARAGADAARGEQRIGAAGLSAMDALSTPDMVNASPEPSASGSERRARARRARVELPAERPSRVVIEDAQPLLDGGRHRAKRCVGDRVEVSAEIFADGHEALRALVHYRRRGAAPLAARAAACPIDAAVGGDRWAGTFEVDELGRWQWQIEAFIDRYASWSDELARKLAVGETRARLRAGRGRRAARAPRRRAPRARPARASRRRSRASRDERRALEERCRAALDPTLAAGRRGAPGPLRRGARTARRARRRARSAPASAAWYELFPRSWGGFAGVAAAAAAVRRARLRRALPAADPPDRADRAQGPQRRARRGARRPRQPVGDRRRRGRAHRRRIRSSARSRTSTRLVDAGRRARASRSRSTSRSSARPTIRGCSEHPEWFRRRPDGTLKYAENPPKRYHDIYNVDFECDDWRGLWRALRDVDAVLGRPRRADLPRRQPAHQAARRSGSG